MAASFAGPARCLRFSGAAATRAASSISGIAVAARTCGGCGMAARAERGGGQRLPRRKPYRPLPSQVLRVAIALCVPRVLAYGLACQY